jgi:hypothetical protein
MRYTVVIRHARPWDAAAVRRLAELDCAAPLHGETVLAVQGDRLVAALSLSDGRVVADPFARTAEAIELLREHAAGLRAGRAAARRAIGDASRRQRALRPRFA